jgi:hypothetical protein
LPVEVKRRQRTARENGVRADALLRGRLKCAAVFMSRHEKHRMSELGQNLTLTEGPVLAQSGHSRHMDVG